MVHCREDTEWQNPSTIPGDCITKQLIRYHRGWIKSHAFMQNLPFKGMVLFKSRWQLSCPENSPHNCRDDWCTAVMTRNYIHFEKIRPQQGGPLYVVLTWNSADVFGPDHRSVCMCGFNFHFPCQRCTGTSHTWGTKTARRKGVPIVSSNSVRIQVHSRIWNSNQSTCLKPAQKASFQSHHDTRTSDDSQRMILWKSADVWTGKATARTSKLSSISPSSSIVARAALMSINVPYTDMVASHWHQSMKRYQPVKSRCFVQHNKVHCKLDPSSISRDVKWNKRIHILLDVQSWALPAWRTKCAWCRCSVWATTQIPVLQLACHVSNFSNLSLSWNSTATPNTGMPKSTFYVSVKW